MVEENKTESKKLEPIILEHNQRLCVECFMINTGNGYKPMC